MPRCPRCLQPVDDERNCVDPRCGYRAVRDGLRPFWMIFAVVGLVHAALVWRFGIPAVDDPTAVGFRLFVGVCWLFVNGAASILLFAAYVFAYELRDGEGRHWLTPAKQTMRPIA
jgi:chromate transport protein ChrA